MIAGRMVEVVAYPRGSQTVADYAIGATTLTLEDLTDYSDGGGQVSIIGVVYDYTLTDTALVVSPALSAAVAADTPVSVMVGGSLASDVYAVVDLGTDGDTVLVPLDYTQRVAYRIGQYDPPLPITVADDLSAVVTAPGATPVVDGGILAPGSVAGDVALEPGSVDGTLLSADAIDGKTITGALLRTAASGARTEISSDGPLGFGRDDVRFYTGHAHEDAPGYVGSQGTGPGTATEMSTFLVAPGNSDVPAAAASVQVTNSNDNGADHEIVWINADLISGGATRAEFASVLAGTGRLLRGIDFGRVNPATTNGSSQFNIAHSLGANPSCVMLTGGDAKQYYVSAVSSTNITVSARLPDASAATGSGAACDIYWLVIR